MAVENDDFSVPLDPDAETLAYKMQQFLKSKEGFLLQLVKIKGNKQTYYWSITHKQFSLVHTNSELYIVPWEPTEKGEYYIYCPSTFLQGNIFLVPKEEIIFMGFN
tara:strand:- start:1297 stop:1614 length:318 start_codon:yes stop_codon:yes gene_type:complete